MKLLAPLFCRLFRHRWRFVIRNLEGEKVFVCRRCGREFYC
jgi:hypothetical protein